MTPNVIENRYEDEGAIALKLTFQEMVRKNKDALQGVDYQNLSHLFAEYAQTVRLSPQAQAVVSLLRQNFGQLDALGQQAQLIARTGVVMRNHLDMAKIYDSYKASLDTSGQST